MPSRVLGCIDVKDIRYRMWRRRRRGCKRFTLKPGETSARLWYLSKIEGPYDGMIPIEARSIEGPRPSDPPCLAACTECIVAAGTSGKFLPCPLQCLSMWIACTLTGIAMDTSGTCPKCPQRQCIRCRLLDGMRLTVAVHQSTAPRSESCRPPALPSC